MASVLIDTSVDDNENLNSPTRTQVVVSTTVQYIFDNDAGADVKYWKSIDGGLTFAAPVAWGDSSTQWHDIYYERWNNAAGRNIVHLVRSKDGGTRGIYYRQLNLDTDTLSTEVLALSLAAHPNVFAAAFGLARDGTLYVSGKGSITGASAAKSTNDGASWSGASGVVTEESADRAVGWADFQSAELSALCFIYWDDDVNALSVKRWNAATDTIVETAIATLTSGITDTTNNLGSALDNTTGHLKVAALEVSGAGSNNLKTWDVYGATVTAKTNVLSATTHLGCVAMSISTDGIRCWYGRDAGAASIFSLEIYYKLSTNDMTSWGTETLYSSRDSSVQRIIADPAPTGAISPAWEESSTDDLYIEAPSIPVAEPEVEQFRLMLSDGADPDIPVLNITAYNIAASPLIKTERGRDSAVLGNPPRAGQASLTLNNVGLHWGLDQPTPGLAVRLNKMYDGDWYHMWHGNLHIPSHQMTPFRPTVTVRALGTLTKLARKKITTSLYQNITVGAAIGHLLDAAGFPSILRDLDTGEVTLLYWWCPGDSDAMSELQKLVNSEGITADLYEQGDGKIVFRSRSARYTETRSDVIQTTFNVVVGAAEPLISPPEYFSGYDEIVNKATHSRVTRLADADPTVVWSDSTQNAWLLTPGAHITLWATASEPFMDAITPVLDTDYNVSYGSVTVSLDRTSGSRVGITFTEATGTNTAAFGFNNITLTQIQLRATSIPQLGTDILEQQTLDTSASIAAYGVRDWQGEMSKELDWATMRDNLDAIVTWKQTPRGRVRFSLEAARSDEANEATAKREIGDRVRVIEPQLDFDGELWIERIEHEINAPAGPVDGTVVGREITTYECVVVSVAVGSSGTGVGADNPYDSIDNGAVVIPGDGFDEAHPATRQLANVI